MLMLMLLVALVVCVLCGLIIAVDDIYHRALLALLVAGCIILEVELTRQNSYENFKNRQNTIQLVSFSDQNGLDAGVVSR